MRVTSGLRTLWDGGCRTRSGVAGMLATLLSACATVLPPVAAVQAPIVRAPVEQRAPVTILVSIDGFRPDYLDRAVTPRLLALAQAGVRAPMHPSFPSKTFPNHWTIVTGLNPDHHGIVANKMEDAARPKKSFTMASDDPFWWNQATPLWVDAEKAGIRTATMFWPGSNVAVGGIRATDWPNTITGGTRPEDWQQFNQQISSAQRVRAVLDWLRRPAAIRPRFVTLYFDPVDTAGHIYGPAAPETTDAVAKIDGDVGVLVDGLAEMGQPANIVVVSDHGMAPLSDDRVIRLDRIAHSADYRAIETGPYASLAAVPGHERALDAQLLRPHPHLQCWRKAEIPKRFHYGTHPRIPPYFCLAETGWNIVDVKQEEDEKGNHGFDNMSPEMTALFIANGPSFARGRTLAPFVNVDIAPLMRDLLGLPAKLGDGDDAPFRDVLVK